MYVNTEKVPYCLKEHCHRTLLFSASFIAEIFTWYLNLFPKCSNGLTETSNEWWLREQTIMNFWQYFQGMALEVEKTG